VDEFWHGETPYFLTIRHPQETDGAIVHTVIDLDEADWMEANEKVIGLPGRWFLVDKVTRGIVIGMVVEEGDRPYYKARHVGMGSMVEEMTIQNEVIAYGLGRIRSGPSGEHDERIWHFADGLTVMGDDVNPFGIDMVKILNTVKLAERQAIQDMEKMMLEHAEQPEAPIQVN
jgi:hypothetical protein